jgi:membrane dipeptidase
MMIIDGHQDIAHNAIDWDRDLTRPIREIREAEAGMPQKGRGANVCCFEEFKRGQFGLVVVTVHSRLASYGKRFSGVRTQETAYAKAKGELAYYRLMERQGYLRQVRNTIELEAHLSAWEKDPQATPLGFVLSMEGADPIVSDEYVEDWWDEGLRIVSLCHYGCSAYAHGTQAPGGLTERGVQLLKTLDAAGIILDTSHLAERAFWQALDTFDGPLIATHNGCRRLCDHDRQIDDAQIQALVRRGGVIGIAFDIWMLSPLWDPAAMDNSRITLETVVDHMDHICQIAGNAHHVAIGTDLDGGYGREQAPADVDTIADLQKIPAILDSRGYSQEDITNIMHGNWLRRLRESWTS